MHKWTYMGAVTPTETIKATTKHRIGLQSTALQAHIKMNVQLIAATHTHRRTRKHKKKQPSTNTSCHSFHAINSSFKNMISDILIANPTCHQFTHHDCDRHCSKCHSRLSFFPSHLLFQHPSPPAPTLSPSSSPVVTLWGQWEDRRREVGNKMTKDMERVDTQTE